MKQDKICDNCNKHFLKQICPSTIISKYNFCCNDCHYQWQKENLKGENNPFFDKKHTEKSIQKIREKATGRPSWIKGKTLEEYYGEQRAKEIRKKNSEKHKGLQAGKANPFYGKHHTVKTRNQLRDFHIGLNAGEKNYFWGKKGIDNYNFGKPRPAETIKRISNTIRENWRNEEFAKKMLASFKITPNGKELYLDFLLQNYFPDEWKFVGDGQVIIDGLCPDFINVNGKKMIIEVFGDYWHNRKNMKYHQTENGRKESYEKFGYSTLIIWEHEFVDENKVIEKIKEFYKNELEKI